MLSAEELARVARDDVNEWIPPRQALAILNAEREAIAHLVETATDAHDLYDIAARIRARKEI